MEITKTDDLVKKYEEYEKSFLNGETSPFRKKAHTRGKVKKYYKITGRTLKKMLMK